MRRFVEGVDRSQTTLFPECLEDWIGEDNPARVVDVFVEEFVLAELGFGGVDPEATGRPSYHPSILLKLYIYGYLNRVQSSRRLEYEAGRNVEVMWLLGLPATRPYSFSHFQRTGCNSLPQYAHRVAFIAMRFLQCGQFCVNQAPPVRLDRLRITARMTTITSKTIRAIRSPCSFDYRVARYDR
jgi:transposase